MPPGDSLGLGLAELQAFWIYLPTARGAVQRVVGEDIDENQALHGVALARLDLGPGPQLLVGFHDLAEYRGTVVDASGARTDRCRPA